MTGLAVIVLSFLLPLVLLVSPAPAVDCFTDLDCPTGERCMKQAAEEKGACFEGRRPGPSLNLGQGKEQPKPLRHTTGKTCWGSKDCDPGEECVIKDGQMYGTCR